MNWTATPRGLVESQTEREQPRVASGLRGAVKGALALSPDRAWRLTIFVTLTACAIGMYAEFIRGSGGGIRICGKAQPGEISDIKRAAHRKIFTRTGASTLARMPKLIRPYVWKPIHKLISDIRHPIEIIHLQPNDTAVVWFRGPEQKAYVNGKEHGWFLQSVSLVKTPQGWQ